MFLITSGNSKCHSLWISRVSYLFCRHHLCGYDLNLTYPQNGTFPTLNYTSGQQAALNRVASHTTRAARSLKDTIVDKLTKRQSTEGESTYVSRSAKRSEWKRDLSGRANGTIDSWYGCDIFDEMIDYAVNFTFPWSKRLNIFMIMSVR